MIDISLEMLIWEREKLIGDIQLEVRDMVLKYGGFSWAVEG